jgi:hypothetical protein
VMLPAAAQVVRSRAMQATALKDRFWP